MRLTDQQRKARREEAANFLSARQNLGINQGVAAAAIGISRSMLSLYETGRSALADNHRMALYAFYRLVDAAQSAGMSYEDFMSKTEEEKSELTRKRDEKELILFSSEPGPFSDEKRQLQKFRRRSGSFTQKEAEGRWRELFPNDAISQNLISGYENGYTKFTEAQVLRYDSVLDSLLAENPNAIAPWEMRGFLGGNEIPEPELHIKRVAWNKWIKGDNPEDLARKVRKDELETERSKVEQEIFRLEWEIDRSKRDPSDLSPDRSALSGFANVVKLVDFQQWDREYAEQQKARQVTIVPDEEKK
jgi:transcriptional regulator with XRE-family HTH domain